MMPQNSAPAKGPAWVNSQAKPPVMTLANQLPRGARNPRKMGAAIRKDRAPEKTIRRFLGIRLSMKWKMTEKNHTERMRTTPKG